MAQKQMRTPPEQENPVQAINDVKRVLSEFAQPQNRQSGSQRVEAAINEALQKAGDAVRTGRRIDSLLGVDRHEEEEEQEQTGTELNDEINRLDGILEQLESRELGGAQETVREIREDLGRARQMLENGDERGARRALVALNPQLTNLYEVVSCVRNATSAGLPQEMVNAAGSTLGMIRNGELERANLVMEGINRIAENRDLYETPAGADAGQAIASVTMNLANTENTFNPSQIEEASAMMHEAERQTQQLSEQRREMVFQALNYQAERFGSDLTRLSSNLRAPVREVMSSISELQARIRAGGHVSDSEIRVLAMRVLAVESMMDDLDNEGNTPLGRGLSQVYQRAMSALERGDMNQYNMLMFVIRQIRREAGNNPSYAASLLRAVQRLSDGQGMDDLISVMSREMSTRIGLYDQEEAQQLSRELRENPGGSSLELLERADAAHQVFRDMNEVPINSERREESMSTYQRALDAAMDNNEELSNIYRTLAGRLAQSSGELGESVSGMARRVQQGEQMAAMHRLINGQDQLSPQQAARQVLGGEAADEQVNALAGQYESLGENEQSRGLAILNISREAETFQQLLESRDSVEQLRSRSRGPQRQIYQNTLDSVDSVLGQLSRGEEISSETALRLQSQIIMVSSERPGQIGQILAISTNDPQERQEMLRMGNGIENMGTVLRGLDGETRDNAVHIYEQGMVAIQEGRMDDALTFFNFAQAYARARTAGDRNNIRELATRFENSFLTPEARAALPEGQQPITADAAQWLSRTYFDRVAMIRELPDQASGRRYAQYSDLAIQAYRNGDTEGANALRNTADLYGRAARVGGSSEEVRAVTGMHQGNEEQGIPSYERLRDGIANGESVAHILGATEEAQEGPALERYSLNMLELQVGVDVAEHRSRGREVNTPRSRERYQAETARIDRLIAQARSENDDAEVQRLQEYRQIIDLNRTSERLEQSDTDFNAGIDMIRQAIEERRQALEATEPDAQQRLRQQAAEHAGRGTELTQVAAGLQESTLLLHRSIRQLYTRGRDSGRIELDRAASIYAQLGEGMRTAEGPLSQEAQRQQHVLLRNAGTYFGRGYGIVQQQLGIQRTAWGYIRRADQLTEENEANAVAFADVSRPLPPDIQGPPPPAYDQDGIQEEIDRGRSAARSENFGSASRHLGASRVMMDGNVRIARISQRHYRLIEGASEAEQSGGMEYFRTQELLGWADDIVEAGRTGRTQYIQTEIGALDDTISMDGRRQELHNGVTRERRIQRSSEAAARRHDGAIDTQYFNEETTVYAQTLEQDGDQRAYIQLRSDNRAEETRYEEDILGQGRALNADERRQLESMRQRHRQAEQGFLDSHETGRPADLARLRAFQQNQAALRPGFNNLAEDARGQATQASDRAQALARARDSIENPEDVTENNPYLGTYLIEAMGELQRARERRRATGNTEIADMVDYPVDFNWMREQYNELNSINERTGQLTEQINSTRDADERTRLIGQRSELIRRGAEVNSRVIDYFRQRPDRMELSTTHLNSRINEVTGEPFISEALMLGLNSESASIYGLRRFQEHSRGWNFAELSADRFMEVTSATDAHRRASPHGIGERLGRRSLDYNSGRFLQIFNYASRSPERIGDDIRTGRTVRLGAIEGDDGRGIVIRQGDDIYEDRILRTGGTSGQLVDLWRDATRGTFDAMITMQQGLGEEAEATTAEARAFRDQNPYAWRLMTLHHPTAVSVTEADTFTTFAALGFEVDPRTGETLNELNLTREEQEVLMRASGSVAQARSQVLNIVSGLTSFASTDDGREAMRALETQMATVRREIGPIIERAGQRRTLGENPTNPEELARITSRINTANETAMSSVETHMEEGRSDDRVVMYVTTGAKIVGYGIMAATGYGLPAAAVGMVEAFASAEEQRISLGGVDQMTGWEQTTYYGSQALGVAGVFAAGGSSVLRVVGPEAVAASRGLQALRLATTATGYGMMVGGLGIGVAEIANMAIYGGDNVSAGDYIFAGFNAAQPFLQMGGMRIMSRNPSLMHGNSFRAIAYRGFMAAMFGASRREMIIEHNFEARYQTERARISRGQGLPPARARAQIRADTNALRSVESTIGRELAPHERMEIYSRYRDQDGRATAIDSDRVAEQIAAFERHVDGEVGALSTESQQRLAGIEQRIERPLEPGETLAIIDHFGDNIPEVGRVVHFLESERASAAASGRQPFRTFSDYQEAQPEAPSNVVPIRPGETQTEEIPMEQRYQMIDELNLTNAQDLAEFARELVLHQRGIRPNEDVARQFNMLPEAVQQSLSRLTGDGRFVMNSQGTDSRFRAYRTNRRTGGAAIIETVRAEIQGNRPVPPIAQAQEVPIAVGETPRPVQTEGQVIQLRPGQAVGLAHGEQPVAMTGSDQPSPARVDVLVREATGHVDTTSPHHADAQRIRNSGRPPEEVAREILTERINITSDDVRQAADDWLSGDPARMQRAQERIGEWMQEPDGMARYEALHYMTSPGSEYIGADSAGRTRIARSLGQNIVEESGGMRDSISPQRADAIRQIAIAQVSGNTAPFEQAAPTFTAQEARLFSRTVDVMTRGPQEIHRISGIMQHGASNPQEQQIVDRVNQVMARRNMSQQDAIAFVADEIVRPHTVTLQQSRYTNYYGGQERSTWGYPADFQTRDRAPAFPQRQVPEGPNPLRTAQRARILGRLDRIPGRPLEDMVRSSCAVYEVEVMQNGVPRRIVAKVFLDPDNGNFEQNFGMARNEVRNLEILSQIRVRLPDGREVPLGPETFGFVDVEGNPAIGMERIHGRAIDEMSVAEIRQFVTDDTMAQLRAMHDGMIRAGYDIGDFQFAVLTQDQVVNGVQRRAGDVVFWDAGALTPLSGDPVFSTREVVVLEERGADSRLLNDALTAQPRDDGTVRPLVDNPHINTYNEMMREMLVQRAVDGGSPRPQAEQRFSGLNTENLTREYLGMSGNDGTFTRQERRQHLRNYLDSLPPAQRTRYEQSIRIIEQQSGAQLLPSASPGGGGPAGGPPSGGGPPPTIQQSPTSIAGQIVSGADVTVPTAMRQDVGIQVAEQLGLRNGQELAGFARDVVLHQRGIRPNEQVMRQFEALPEPVQAAVRELSDNNTFALNAQRNDQRFRQYCSGPGSGRIQNARSRIIEHMPPRPEPQVQQMAVGQDVSPQAMAPQHPPPRQGSGQVVGMIHGEQPVAMAGNQGDGQPPNRPPPAEPPRVTQAQADAIMAQSSAQQPDQIPEQLRQAVERIASRWNNMTQDDINQFVEALVSNSTVLSDDQLQRIADRVSSSLGLSTIDISNWRVRDLALPTMSSNDQADMAIHIPADLTVADAARMTVDFARGARREAETHMPDATRVYLMRDGFPVMAADNEMAAANRESGNPETGRTAGILISRGTVGQANYNIMKSLVRDARNAAMSSSETPMVAFGRSLRSLVASARQHNPDFNAACERILQSLIQHGAIRTENGRVVDQDVMFVDTGFVTFPALLGALVENAYPNVRAGTLYHTIRPGFESVLPHMNVQGNISDKSIYIHEALGAAASFLEGGTMDDTGAISVTPHSPEGIRNSILYQILLNNMIMRGGGQP